MYEDMYLWADSFLRNEAMLGNEHTWKELAEGALAASKSFRQEMVDLLLRNGHERQCHTSAASECRRDTVTQILEAVGLSESPKDQETEDGQDAQLAKKLTWRLKRVLGRMGFSYGALLREALQTMQSKISWALSFSAWYFTWLHEPQFDEYLVWLDESGGFDNSTGDALMEEPYDVIFYY